MRLLGLDVGDKTIGVAVSDLLGITAQGITTVKRTRLRDDIEKLLEIIQQFEVEKIVIGLPKNMNGTLGPQAEKVKDFRAHLQKKTGLPIVFWDERLSSVEAEKFLIQADVTRSKRKKVIDKMAAVVILQSFLNSVSQ